ncbi:enoyl-CoA hydratase/isomerase family protein [Mycolicibacterium helvum]|uniref:Enoyl-CoA hydratase n=1 Tax=Mycolicibacterium helvum TaxID=1534349 RepID=A0A7I7T234_9MYCO|nr:enoyl-CoA hydratase/isomerase family protein [Mycolicibacterium helvum]BBY62591.1 enoyl-CoA hydratase [Mycolicibacterium helvum]
MSQPPSESHGDTELVVTTAQDDAVLVLRLNRPHRLNALNESLVDALEAALAQAVDDERRAVIITGTGRAFCAGFDLKEDRDDGGLRQIDGQQRLAAALTSLPIPVVAAINGLAVGAGCEIALACDFVVAGSDAQFSLPEVLIGTGMGGGTSFLLGLTIGRIKASEFVLLGEPISAAQADAIGLISRVVEPDQLPAAAEELAAKLVSRPPHAIATVKAALFRGLNQTFADALSAELTEVHAAHFHPDSAALMESFRHRSTGRTPA